MARTLERSTAAGLGWSAAQPRLRDLGVASREDVVEADSEVRVLGLVGEDVELVVVDRDEDLLRDLRGVLAGVADAGGPVRGSLSGLVRIEAKDVGLESVVGAVATAAAMRVRTPPGQRTDVPTCAPASRRWK